MKDLLDKLRRLRDVDNHLRVVKIAAMYHISDPYAHHWYRQTNHTLCCNKCGQVNLGLFAEDTKCTVHTNHPSN